MKKKSIISCTDMVHSSPLSEQLSLQKIKVNQLSPAGEEKYQLIERVSLSRSRVHEIQLIKFIFSLFFLL